MFIIGAGALGEIAVNILLRRGDRVAGFFDDVTGEKEFCGIPVLGKIADMAGRRMAEESVFVAIGDNKNRRLLSEKALAAGFSLANVIDASATVEASAVLGAGNLLMAGSYIGVSVTLGSGNLVFPGVSLTHHNQVGDFNFFSPNASVGGYTHLGDDCKISMGCVVAPYICVATGTFVPPLQFFEGVPKTGEPR